ncbi:HEAT repeat domain-containing protein [Candidatus Uabimicrobium sp. HlEnr_7]|uniref:HEAT repeat domain-containing protein n=1 Tax=Candidatus Uabimicrobium helgolandensis TaxID=3095367 RepID=UPI003557D6BA
MKYILVVVFISIVCAQDTKIPNLLDELRKVNGVYGKHTGFAAMPGQFYTLSQEFMKVATNKDFEYMTTSKNPIYRAMGILGLWQRKKIKAISFLKKHLIDMTPIEYCPNGCLVRSTTIGGFTKDLITGKTYSSFSIENLKSIKSILPKKEAWLFKIMCIANDDYTPIFSSISNFDMKDEYLDITKIGSFSPYLFVKGLGRLSPNKQILGFLIQCLNDQSLNGRTRMSAASALSHYSDQEAIDTLGSHKAFINGFAPDLTEKFIEICKSQKAFREFEKKRRYNSNLKNLTLELMVMEPLLVFSSFTDFLSSTDKDIQRVTIDAIKRLETQLVHIENKWSTYSHIPYLITASHQEKIHQFYYNIISYSQYRYPHRYKPIKQKQYHLYEMVMRNMVVSKKFEKGFTKAREWVAILQKERLLNKTSQK